MSHHTFRVHQKSHKLHLRSVLYDDRGAISVVRTEPVPVAEFTKYCATRRRHKTVDHVEFRKAVDAAKTSAVVAARHNRHLNQNKW